MAQDQTPPPNTANDSPVAASHRDQKEWDERYAESTDGSDDEVTTWSDQPNGSLVAEISGHGEGRRVLDIGCGEGADAIWLHRQGWQVEAIDISSVAIRRATKVALSANAPIDFMRRDVLTEPPSANHYDLITISYPAIRVVDAGKMVDDLISALRPGGELLVIGHAHDETEPLQVEEHGFDPSDYLSIDQIAARLDPTITIDVNEKRPRPNPPPDSKHREDQVLRASKPRASPGS